MENLSKGQVLLEKLEEVTRHADLNSKQAIKSATFGIEQTVEILHGRKKKLEDAWEERKTLLEQSVKSSALDERIKKCTTWLQTEGEPHLTSSAGSYGHTFIQTEELTKKHHNFMKTYKVKTESVQKVVCDGQKLIHAGHFDSATIKYKIGKLDQSFNLFTQQMDLRENLLIQTQDFFSSSPQVILSLESLSKKLQQKPTDAEKAKVRSKATEVSSSLLREGQLLIRKTKNKSVNDIVKKGKDLYDSILVLTDDQKLVDDKEMLIASKNMERVSSWLTNICEEFINIHKNMGCTKGISNEFQKDHEQLFEELNNTGKEITNLRSIFSQFSRKKKKLSMEVIEKLDAMQSKSVTLTSRIKYRILLVKMFGSFLDRSDDVLKQIFLLEEELTSDEPHENINATSATLNRQKQEKEEIINSAEILQEEGQRILEDLSLCSEESALDRNAIKMKVAKDLKNIVMHTIQLEELWDQREAQLDTNKRLSTQFFEFEKEIRKVIGWIHNQSETFFPLTGEFPGLAATHKDLDEKLIQVRNVAQLANAEIEGHLETAESLATSSEQGTDSAKVVTNELKLVHQKFKTKLTKYEALLSMCSTFYTSVEKLVTLMNKSLHDFTSDFLPRDTLYVQQKLNDHLECFGFVEELFAYTLQNAQDVLLSIKEYEELGIKSTKIEDLLNINEKKTGAWKEFWDGNQMKLEENLKILQLLQDISQIALIVEEHTRKLLKINKKFGTSLLSAVTLCQESDSFHDQVKTTEQRIGQLRTNVSKFVQSGHPDGKQLDAKLNLLEKRWMKLFNLMEDHKTLLNTAVEFYQLCEQVETWLKDSHQFVKTTRGGARRCTTEKDIRELIQLIINFKFSGVEIQESRLQRLSEISSSLNNEDAKARSLQLKDSQQRVNMKLDMLQKDMESQISKMQTGEKISNEENETFYFDVNHDVIDDLVIPEKRVMLSAASDPHLTMDVSRKGEDVMEWADNLDQGTPGVPKLLVTVTSSTQVPTDMQQRISPLVRSEMNNVSEKGIYVGSPFHSRSEENEKIPLEASYLPSQVRTIEDGTVATLGPQIQQEISVKTDYNIETSPPSPSIDDKGLMYTMKKTLVTTTKEVTIRTKQEVKTELEVIHIDSEDELPKRLALVTDENDKVGVSVTTMSGINNIHMSSSKDLKSNDIKKELQMANENICKGVENNLFCERSTFVVDDSVMITPNGEKDQSLISNDNSNLRYEITAKDANNQGIKIPKGNTSGHNIAVPDQNDDYRPISMVELTLNLDGIDMNLEAENTKTDRPPVSEDAITIDTAYHNVQSVPENDFVDETEANHKSQDNMETAPPPQDPLKLAERISESQYTNNLVDDIMSESVRVFDAGYFLDQLTAEENKYEKVMSCVIKNYMDKIAVAPLKLQRNKEAIFRNIKDLYHFCKNIFSQQLNECKTAEDIAVCYLKHHDKLSKMFNTYISKGADLENILINASYFQHCSTHKSDLKEHLQAPQKHLDVVCAVFEDMIEQKTLLKKDTKKLKFTLQLLKDMKNLVQRNSKEISDALKLLDENNVEELSAVPVIQAVEETPNVALEVDIIENMPDSSSKDSFDNVLMEYEIIDSGTINSFGHVQKDTDFFMDKPRYIVSKSYTAKKKDEIPLPLGSEVCILDTNNDRSFVAALNKSGQELDRGWIPTYCLQHKEDAVDITSKEAKAPEFITPLSSCSAVEGNPVKLAIQVNGFPKPEIVWYLDGLPVRNDIHHRIVEENNTVALHILPAVIDDEGLYTVKAVNTLGSATCQAEFIVESDVSSMSGLSDLEWEETGVPVKNEKNKKTFIVGEKIKFRAEIEAEYAPRMAVVPPSFIQTLKDAEYLLGSKAKFQVKVQGDPLPEVSWFLNNKTLDHDKRLFIEQDNLMHTLYISNVNERDNGTLRCELFNTAGKESCSCSLKIVQDVENNNNNNPSAFSRKSKIEVAEDDDAKLEVEYSGQPEPEINWYRDNIHLTKEYGVDIITDNGICRMILPEVTKDDAGVYTCIVKNTSGEEKCDIMLNVMDQTSTTFSDKSKSILELADEGPPKILEQFHDKQIYEGDTLTFQVKVTSKPNLTVQWFRDDEELLGDAHVVFEHSGSYYRLIIPVCDLTDGGKYLCMIKNQYGTATCSGHIAVQESIFAPKFVEHSKDMFVEKGDRCIIYATIKAKPAATVEWYKDNRSLKDKDIEFKQKENTYSIVIPDVSDTKIGTYKCTAFNNAGESACIVAVTMVGENTIPTFTDPLCDIKADIGDTVKLESTVKSKSNVDVFWFKNGETIYENEKYGFEQGSESHSLLIHDVQLSDSGMYICRASNTTGESSCECNLVVDVPKSKPSFTKQLSDLQVPEHQKAVEIKVVAMGNPKPQVLFYKDDALLESSPRRMIIQEGDEHVLTFKYVLMDDSGHYTVVATNTEGEELTHGVLSVLNDSKAPTFSECQSQYNVNEGEEVTLQATASGVPLPVVEWYRGDQLLEASSSKLGYSEVVKIATSDDADEYTCVATNNVGKIQKQVQVIVDESKMFPPEFSSSLSDLEVNIGSVAHLELGIVGHPKPDIIWKKDGKPLFENESVAILSGSGVCSVTVNNCQEVNAGCYECTARNQLGDKTCRCLVTISKKAGSSTDVKPKTLEKSKAPKFLQCLNDLHVAISEPIILETVVSGDPFPDIRWYKQDKLLHPSKRAKIASNGRDGKSSLRIVNASKDDAGDYECVAKNKHGETSISCEIFVKESKKSKVDGRKKFGKPVKPSISNKPSDTQVMEGDEVKFSFVVHGIPKPKIEILKDEKVWKKPPRVVASFEEDTFSFNIAESILKDEGVYEFFASNSLGKDSFKIEILVDESAELEVVAKTIGDRRQSKDDQATKSESSSTEDELDSKRKISPRPHSRRSKKQKKLLVPLKTSDDGSDSETVSDRCENAPEMAVEEVIASVQDHAVETAAFSLDDFNELPEFLEEFANNKVIEGKPIKLSGRIKGLPAPFVKWYKDGKELFDKGDVVIEQSGETISLKILKAKKQDSGNYTCTVENVKGKISCVAKIEVCSQVKPDWVRKLQDVTVTEGEKAIMEVVVNGDPPPDVQFFYDNRVVQNTDRVSVISDKENGHHSILINNSTLRDSKSYKCVARNNHGTITCFANCRVKETVIAPSFSCPLQDCDVTEGRDMKLRVEVTGKPKPLSEWFFNDQLLKPSARVKIRSERESNILQVSSCKFDDAGIYKVAASNIAGEVTTSCNVKVLEDVKPPDFIYIPKPIKTSEGRATSFRVSYNGRPDPVAEWFFNNSKIESDSSFEIKSEPGKSNLSIKHVELNHAGHYTCKIVNKCGENSCNLELLVDEVQSRPTFIEKLKDTSCTENENLNLKVSYKGKPKPKITWYRGDFKLESNEQISISDESETSNLFLSNCSLQDGGVYKVTLKNVVGEVNCKAKVLVEEFTCLPEFEMPLTDITHVEGQNLDLTVAFNGKPKPRLRWLKNGVELESNSDTTLLLDGYHGTLKLDNVKVSHAGTYECVAQNKAGIAKTTCNLKVDEALSAPVFTKRPYAEVQLLDGDVFLVDFIVVGKPFPEIEVTKDGKTIANSGVTFDFIKQSGSGILKVPGVTKLDEGLYKVIAKNSEGSKSFTVCMEVKDAEELMFVQHLTDMTVVEDANAVLEVMFKGNVVDVDWYKDNEYIDESDKYQIIDEENRCTCVVHNCCKSDSGIYRCEILNEKNSQSCSSKLMVTKEVSSNIADQIIPEQSIEVKLEEGTEKQPEKKFSAASSPPIFTNSLPSKLDVIEGKDCIMSVTIEGQPKPKLTFCKDGDEIRCTQRVLILPIGKNTLQLKIKEVSLNDEGEYSVKASSGAGFASCKTDLYVQMEAIPPKFTTKPLDIQVIEGEGALFQMKVSGKPLPKVKVYHNSVAIATAEYKDNCFQFVVEKCDSSVSGKYKFEASNTAGQSSTSASLSVQEMAKEASFEKPLEDVTVTLGEVTTLFVAVEGNPPPKVSFFKGSKKLSESKKYNISVEDNRVFLKVNKTTLKDAGEYTCEIRNEAGQDKCIAKVTVNFPPSPPTFYRKLESNEIIEGEVLLLEVEVDGNPLPIVTWKKDGDPVENMQDECDNGIKRLLKPVCELSDEGTYTAIATSDVGEVKCSSIIAVRPLERLPYFEKELENVNITEREILKLEIAVRGYPKPEIEWYKDEQSLKQIDGYVFESDINKGIFSVTCRNATLDASGVYMALAVSEIGESTSQCKAVVQEKPEKPKFVEKYSNQVVEEGNTVIFTASVSGKPRPELNWYRGNELIRHNVTIDVADGITTATLQLHDISIDDGGHYVCVAKNASGEISHSAKLNVKEIIYPPEFKTRLDDLTTVEGQEVTITALCNGTLPLVSKWTKNGKPVYNTSSTRIEKTDYNFVLKIPKPGMQDSGEYGLDVSNSAGHCFMSCNLVIKEAPVAPSFIQKLRDFSVQEGKETECTVKSVGKPDPEIEWFLNDEEIVNGENIIATCKPDGKAMLKIKAASLNEKGVLRCQATNIAGTASTTCKLKITELRIAPEFLQQLEDVTIYEGEELTLKAVVSGKPVPTVSWSKSQKEIKESADVKIYQEGQECYLLKSKAQHDDQGKYRITVSNKAGERFSSSEVTVKKNIEAPVFVTVLENLMLRPKETLTLFTEVIGEPKPIVTWKKDGEILKSEKRISVNENKGACTVVMKDVSEDDSGVYSCVATNDGGEVVTEAEVDIQEEKTVPVFTKGLDDCVFQEGADIILSVCANGIPTPEVHFFKENKVIQSIDGIYVITDDTGMSTITIEDAQIDDGGVYECKATNECGEIQTSCLVKINETQEKPSIVPVEDVVSVNAAKGANAVLEVEIFGNPQPIVEWACGEILLDPSEKYEMIDAEGYCSLIIHDVNSDDDGEYICIASNDVGEVEQLLTIKVGKEKPVIEEDDFLVDLIENVESAPEPSKDERVSSVEERPTKNSNVEEKVFEKTVEKIRNRETSKIQGDIISPEETQPVESTGTNVALMEASKKADTSKKGKPPVVPIKKPKKVAESASKQEELMFAKSVVAVDSAPILAEGVEDAKIEDARETCKDEEIPSSARNKQVTGTPPTFSMKPKDKDVVAGSDARFTCNSRGSPDPVLDWFFEGCIIESSKKHQVKNTYGLSTLIIKNVEHDDIGSYKVVSKNVVGECESSFRLNVQGLNKRAVEKEKKISVTNEKIKPVGEQKSKKTEVLLKRDEAKVIEDTDVTDDVAKKEAEKKEEVIVVKDVLETVKFKTVRDDDVVQNLNDQCKQTLAEANESDDGKKKNISKKNSVTESIKEKKKAPAPVPPKPKPEKNVDARKEEDIKQVENIKRNEKQAEDIKMKAKQVHDVKTADQDSETGPVNVEIEFQGDVPLDEVNKPQSKSIPVEVSLLVETKPQFKPTIVTPLIDKTVIEGADVLFKAEFSGNVPMEFSWFKDEVAVHRCERITTLVEGNCAVLLIKNSNIDDEAEYVCVAENYLGSCETAAELLVDEAEYPVQDELDAIEKRMPSTQEISVKPTKEFESSPPKGAKEVVPLPTTKPKPKPPVSAPKTAKKPIPDTPKKELAPDVPKKKKVPDVPKKPVVDIPKAEKLEFSKSLTDCEYDIDEPAELEVVVQCKKELQLEWFIDEDRIEEDEAIHFVSSPPSYKLKIDSLLEEDEGEYSCVVTDASTKNQITSSCMLTVIVDNKVKPTFKTPLEPGEADVGDFFEFRALVHGAPSPTASWYFKGQQLNLSKKHEFGQDGYEHFLIVDNCTHADAGEYKLVIASSEGEESCCADLHVLGKKEEEEEEVPILSLSKGGEHKVTQTEGEEVFLSVYCDCKAEPNIIWLKDGEEVTTVNNVVTSSDEKIFSLRIKEASIEDAGTYTCVAENKSGKHQVSVEVNIIGKSICLHMKFNFSYCLCCRQLYLCLFINFVYTQKSL